MEVVDARSRLIRNAIKDGTLTLHRLVRLLSPDLLRWVMEGGKPGDECYHIVEACQAELDRRAALEQGRGDG